MSCGKGHIYKHLDLLQSGQASCRRWAGKKRREAGNGRTGGVVGPRTREAKGQLSSGLSPLGPHESGSHVRVKPHHGPVEGTSVNFIFDDAPSPTTVSWHRAERVSSRNCRPDQQKVTRICIPARGQRGRRSDFTEIIWVARRWESLLGLSATVLEGCSLWPSEPVSCPHVLLATCPHIVPFSFHQRTEKATALPLVHLKLNNDLQGPASK